MRLTIAILLCLSACAFGGCAKGVPPHKAIYKAALQSAFSVCDSMSQISDSASAEKASVQIRQQAERVRDLARDLRALGKLTKAQDEKMRDLIDEMNASTARYGEEGKRLDAICAEWQPESRQAVAESLQEFGKALTEFCESSLSVAP
jgi:DNA-binding transcriptional regulator GbsR (MarR family)